MSVIDTDEIRGTADSSQAEPLKVAEDFQEVDPAFQKMVEGDGDDDTDEQQGKQTAGEVTLPHRKYTEAEVRQAEEAALNILGAAFVAVQDFTGNSYGLTEAAAIKTAKGIAPCLAKYRITEPAEVFNKWGEEVQAALAIGALLAGVYREMKKEAANGDKPQQRTAA